MAIDLSDAWNTVTGWFKDEGGGYDPMKLGLTALAGGAAYNNWDEIKEFFTGEDPAKMGYQGSIPRYELIRERMAQGEASDDRTRGGQGKRYFTRPRYATSENAAAVRAQAQEEAGMASGGLASIQRFANGGMPMAPQGAMGMPKPPVTAMPNMMMGANPAARPAAPKLPPQRPAGIAGTMQPNMNPLKAMMGGAKPQPQGGMPMAPKVPAAPAIPAPQQAAPAGPMEPMDVLNSLASTGKVQPMPKPMPPQMPKPMGFANGGIADINRPQAMALSQMQSPIVGQPNPFAARSAQVDNPRYLGGNTDGMADRIPANIDGSQPAALSDGEFVIPADVVSHLGNGNSNAGAQQLYGMMDKIRQARTGSAQQGRQINPNQFMPKV